MISELVTKKSAVLMSKLGVAFLVVVFVVVLGPGLLNTGTSRALARDKRYHRVDYSLAQGADACSETSDKALIACKYAAEEDYNLALGKCDNVANRTRCIKDANLEKGSALDECDAQYEARNEVCDAIGQEPYLPKGIKGFVFIAPDGNEYFPLDQHYEYTYKSIDSSGETIQTTVVTFRGTTTVEGVECRIVTDKVYEGEDTSGNLLEDTIDWYAEDSTTTFGTSEKVQLRTPMISMVTRLQTTRVPGRQVITEPSPESSCSPPRHTNFTARSLTSEPPKIWEK